MSYDPDAALADELEQLPPEKYPRGVIGALLTYCNRLRVRIEELEAHAADQATRVSEQRELINMLEARIADQETVASNILTAMNSLLDTLGVPRF